MDEQNSEDEIPILSLTEVTKDGRKYTALTPRDYQVELFEHAKDKNSIMVLGTGSGKTFIAVMLLQHFAHEIRGPFNVDDPKKGSKRTFLIANTVPLVQQQAEVIKQSTSYAVKSYDGSMGVDFWSNDQWQKELEEVEVLVMVAEIFRMMLDHKFIDFSRINLLIIDECHHATGKHPMREAMRNYATYKEMHPSASMPRILGLTASVIQKKCKPHEIDGMLKNLETCLDSQLTTATDYNQVLKFTTNPVEVILQFRPSICPLSYNGKLVEEWIKLKLTTMPLGGDEDAKKSMKKVKRVLTNMLTTLVELGEWCAGRAIEYEKEHLLEAADEEKVPELKNLYQEISKEMEELYKECLIREKDMNIQENLSHQSLRLIDFIRHIIEEFGDDICGLVFVKTRATAKLLSKLLNHIAKQENNDNFSSNCVVGSHGTGNFGDLVASSESLAKQKQIIRKFRNKEFKILVATSVLEEGIDVQKCNMVVRFNKPDNFRSYVQAKGRARSRVAFYTLMEPVEGANGNNFEEITQYRALEKKLHSICDNRCLPMPEEVFDFFDDITLPPFAPYGPDGPKITSSSCLQIVGTYCSRLPSDKFTKLGCSIKVRTITDDKGKNEFVAEVRLPKASVIKEAVLGDKMDCKDLAKRSAILKVCELLHQYKELNEHLLPHSSKSIEEMICKEIGCEDLEIGIGSRKLHPTKVCDAFSTNPGKEYWMYLINIDQKNDNYMDVFSGSNQFAILCSEKIYSCNFPLFHSRWKRAHVTLSGPTKITLTADQLKLALHFNEVIFSYLLEIDEDSPLTYDREKSDWKVLFLPINHKKIDESTLQKCLKNPTLFPKKPDLDVQEKFKFESSDYENAVVIPWYRSDKVYYVRKVLNKTPSCSSPNANFSSHEEYFRVKYGLQIFNKSQKMLECSGIGPDMNFLKPKERSSQQNTSEVVPELCLLFPITGKMFYHMKCLPAILLRLNLLNNAAQYMVNVLQLPLPEVDNTLPLEIDWCRKLTADLVAQDGTDNVCTSFQKRDLVRFDEFNSILALGGEENLIQEATANIRPEYLMHTMIPAHADDCFDLERLEVLGDAFLKYHVGQLTYFAFENYDEGRLSCVRSKLVSNAMLYKIGVRTELNKILSYKRLFPKQSGPAPGYVIPPAVEKEIKKSGCTAARWCKYKSDETYEKESKISCYNNWTQSLFADKNVADSIEAMLGFALLTGSITSAHRMLVKLDMKVMKKEVVIPETALIPPSEGCEYRLKPETVYLQYNLDKLEKILNYQFRDKSFLLQAITHATFKGNHITDVYQRLEYLGDAILDFLVTGYIFTVADLSPGKMTDIRIHFVRNETLAKACVQNNIHKFILQNCTVLKNAIKNYIEDLDIEHCDYSSSDSEDEKSAKTESESSNFCEEKGHNTESDDVESEDIEVPKVLGDVVEAIIGAVYIDSRCSLEATWNVVKELIPEIVHDKKFSQVESDWRKQLYETYGKTMKLDIKLPKAKKDKFIVSISIKGFPDVRGAGKNKRLATIAAAKLVMKRHYNLKLDEKKLNLN